MLLRFRFFELFIIMQSEFYDSDFSPEKTMHIGIVGSYYNVAGFPSLAMNPFLITIRCHCHQVTSAIRSIPSTYPTAKTFITNYYKDVFFLTQTCHGRFKKALTSSHEKTTITTATASRLDPVNCTIHHLILDMITPKLVDNKGPAITWILILCGTGETWQHQFMISNPSWMDGRIE
ncbi:hypothetical protein BDA99DRAFT_539120 [Phascolomyces articulosus]|uniref:Uncharacterized protein n=1 Tax=Phascolomyces articulosus TaxID=60185 RepID=A0AAD5JX33_9FUNG|nr:hypothetical protein BDA99DRAFT_539120 [Phascolomyces articulosus]